MVGDGLRVRSRPARWLAALLIGLWGFWIAVPAAEAVQPASFAPLVKAQRAKVVNIHTRASTEPGDDTANSGPVTGPPIATLATGTGVIVGADGLTVTNFHVVANAFDITVTLENGRSYQADIVGTDAQTDLALIRVPAGGLPQVAFALFGGSLSRRFRITRRPARTP